MHLFNGLIFYSIFSSLYLSDKSAEFTIYKISVPFSGTAK